MNNIGNLQNKDGDLLFPNNMQIVTTSDGTGIKFPNGILICFGSKTFTNLDVSRQTENVYTTTTTEYGGTFPVNFITRPVLTFTHWSGGSHLWLSAIGWSSINSIPSFQGFRASGNIISTAVIGYIAIGRWK